MPLVLGCHPDEDGDPMAMDGDTMGETMDDGNTDDPGGTEEGENMEDVCDVESPYMGGWDIGCCQDEVLPQNGWGPGQVFVGTIMPDYVVGDQFGDMVRLYDFCHDAVYFEYAAIW